MASFVIKDVRIFDGKNTIENGAVLVEDGKIKQVSSDTIQFSGTTIARLGHTLLPGFIDCHIHADSGNRTALPQSLSFGVTTVCDMHNEYFNVVKLRKQIEDDPYGCADLKEASNAATVDMGWPIPVILVSWACSIRLVGLLIACRPTAPTHMCEMRSQHGQN